MEICEYSEGSGGGVCPILFGEVVMERELNTHTLGKGFYGEMMKPFDYFCIYLFIHLGS